MIRPAVRELRVIEVESSVGAGVPGDPVRRVKDYYQGEEHLFRVDPHLARKEEAAQGMSIPAPVMAPLALPAATTKTILEAINQLKRAVKSRGFVAAPSVTIELDEASFMLLKEEVRPLLQFRSGVNGLGPGAIEVGGVLVTSRK